MPESKHKHPTEIYLRSYSKAIFFWPLLITSLVLWLIQAIAYDSTKDNITVLGSIWIIVFFINIFVTAFDFSSTKFFLLILIVLLVVLLLVFLVLPNLDVNIGFSLNLGLPWEFYMVMVVILAFILLIVFINARFDYYKVERNEIYHKTGIFSTAERFPTKNLRFKKEIPDVFEFFMLRAGKITMFTGRQDDVMILNTVLNINKREKELDWLLSHVAVEPDEIDGP